MGDNAYCHNPIALEKNVLQSRFYGVITSHVIPQGDVVSSRTPISFSFSPPTAQSAGTPISFSGEFQRLYTTLRSQRWQRVTAISDISLLLLFKLLPVRSRTELQFGASFLCN